MHNNNCVSQLLDSVIYLVIKQVPIESYKDMIINASYKPTTFSSIIVGSIIVIEYLFYF